MESTLQLFAGRGSLSLPVTDYAALAIVILRRPITPAEIAPALHRAGLTLPSMAELYPSDFAERGRLRSLGGKVHPLLHAGPLELLAPLRKRLEAHPRAAPRPATPAPVPPGFRLPPKAPAPPPKAPAPPPKKPAPPPKKPAPPPKPPPRAPLVPPEIRPPPPDLGPPVPPFTAAAVAHLPLGADVVAALLAGPAGGPAAFALALEAHALGIADRFDELLAPGRMHGVEPHGYQVETVRRVLRQLRGRALLADEVGLGKTIEAMLVLREYQLRGMARRTLILVPPALIGQWAGELRNKADIEPHIAGDGDPGAWRREGVIVASLALARAARHAADVTAVEWDLVIVDEAHHLKNRTTQAFKLVDGLRSRFLLLLTATPVENDLVELYNLVTLLKPGQLSTPADFKRRFANPKDPTAARDVPKLRALLGEVMVRNTRANSGLRLPPRYVTTVTVDPTAEEQAFYADVLDVFRTHRPAARAAMDTLLLEAGSSTGAVVASLGRMTSPDPALTAEYARLRESAGRVGGSAKARALLDIFAIHSGKILVFTRFRETLVEVERLAREAGVAAAVVHGGMDRAKKEAALAQFRADVPLLLSTDVGSEGQNLQSCHVLVNYDLPWNPMVIEQRIGRLHRYGQTEPVRIYNLCARGTAEERLLDVLDRRVHLFELVVGEMDMVLGNRVDQADLEEQVLAIYAATRDEAEIGRAFDDIAEQLARARGQYDRVKELDDALFGREMET